MKIERHPKSLLRGSDHKKNMNTYSLCKMCSSVFSLGNDRVHCADGLCDSLMMASPCAASLLPSLSPSLSRANLLGFKSSPARRNSERRKTAGKHIHASCKGMSLKYYCKAQHHFPKISHSLK